MNGSTQIQAPSSCTEEERREFARLVRLGFDGSDEELPDRISNAKWLAFYHSPGDTLAAIAGLKAPTETYREDVFKKAAAHVGSAGYELELGWVFVLPVYRGNRVAASLCRLLLASVPTSRVFATTRPSNSSMIRILLALGFRRTGKPYQRRSEALALYLLPEPGYGVPHAAV